MTYNNNNNEPLVSIIIPTYNRAYILGTAIESAINQTYKNTEVIVVDDGSNDGTEALASSYKNVLYIPRKHAGQAAARNTGLLYARGSLITSLDSDDTWEENFLEECVKVLMENELDFVFANWCQRTRTGEWIDGLSQNTYIHSYYNPRKDIGWLVLENLDLRELYLKTCPSPSSSLVIRRSSMVSGWFEPMNIADDWALLLDIIISRKCKAAFTTRWLWSKKVNRDNIYDGRNRSAVAKLIGEDQKMFMARYSPYLTQREQRLMQGFYVERLILHSLYSFIGEFEARSAAKSLVQAIRTDIASVFPAFFRIIRRGFRTKYSSIHRTKISCKKSVLFNPSPETDHPKHVAL